MKLAVLWAMRPTRVRASGSLGRAQQPYLALWPQGQGRVRGQAWVHEHARSKVGEPDRHVWSGHKCVCNRRWVHVRRVSASGCLVLTSGRPASQVSLHRVNVCARICACSAYLCARVHVCTREFSNSR